MANRSTTHPSVPDWENPAVYGINKRAAHVTLRSFTHPQQAFEHYRLVSETTSSPRRLALNGTNWDFKLVDRPSEVPENFWDPQYDCSQWDKVRNIEKNGCLGIVFFMPVFPSLRFVSFISYYYFLFLFRWLFQQIGNVKAMGSLTIQISSILSL